MLLKNQEDIDLLDSDTGDLYFCKVKKWKQNDMKKYICDGWYQFANDRKLKKCDVLGFVIRSPPYMLYVSVELLKSLEVVKEYLSQ